MMMTMTLRPQGLRSWRHALAPIPRTPPKGRTQSTIASAFRESRPTGPSSSSYAARRPAEIQTRDVVSAPGAMLVGVLAGACGSLTGGAAGGGLLLVPLLSKTLRMPKHRAHGTALLVVAATGVSGTLAYWAHVDCEAAAVLALCGMLTGRAGASASARMSELALRRALGVFLLAVAPLVPAREYLLSLVEPRKDEKHPQPLFLPTQQGRGAIEQHRQDVYRGLTPMMMMMMMSTTTTTTTPWAIATTPEKPWTRRFLVPAGVGLCSGFVAGLFGVGGGVVVVPALGLLRGDMSHREVLATSLCAMAAPAVMGAAAHCVRGNVAMRAAPALAVGALSGAWAGGMLGLSLTEDRLKFGSASWTAALGFWTLLP